MNGFDISEALSITKGSVEVDALYLGSELIWPLETKYLNEYFTITSNEDNNNVYFWHCYYTNFGNKTIEVSTDKVNWTSYTSSTSDLDWFDGNGTLIGNINRGESIYIRGNNSRYTNGPSFGNGYRSVFYCSKNYTLSGNIMSLVDDTNFAEITTLPDIQTFCGMFSLMRSFGSEYGSANTHLINARHLMLPATTITDSCYYGMFAGCTNLITVPKLPATTLAQQCYMNMFYDCTSITMTQHLDAEMLASECYRSMFAGCTSLVRMMTFGALTTAPYCCVGMFYHCSSLTTVPTLKPRILDNSCYSGMFSGCTSLAYIDMRATGMQSTSLSDWLYNVASIGQVEKPSTTNLPINSPSGIPVYWISYDIEGYYSISISATQHGTVTSNCTGALPGDIVTLTITPDQYYYLDSLIVTSSGTPVTVTDNQFIMPEGNVNITAVFDIPSYNINVSQMTHGSVVPSSNTAHEGDIITLTITPDSGYELESLTVVSGSTPITVTNNQFTMPGADVSISAVFINYSLEYLTFTATQDGVSIHLVETNESAKTATIEYKVNDASSWTTVTSSYYGTSLQPLYTGDKMYIKATPSQSYWSSNGYTKFNFGYGIKVSGNIMSLVYGDNFANQTSIPYNNMFTNMFLGCTGITDISNLKLPATTLTQNCYTSMFKDCTTITSAPILPATSLATQCYSGMFYGCTGLTNVPVNMLPATTLSSGCYYDMFYGCTGLTNTPALPATTLAYQCYYEMFRSCTSLTTAPALPATSLMSQCYRSMFIYCTGLTTAPVLPATTLATQCYYQMFNGCTSLNSITCYTTDISATGCTTNWVQSVAATGTFIGDSTAGWSTGSSGIPSGWTFTDAHDYSKDYLTIESLEDDNEIKWNGSSPVKTIEISTDKTNWTSKTASSAGETLGTLNTGDKLYVRGNNATYASSKNYYHHFVTSKTFKTYGNIMSLIYGDNFVDQAAFTADFALCGLFRYNTRLTDITNLVMPATTLTTKCYQVMFNGCTRLTSVPSNLLPATTLQTSCYANMFEGCTGLTSLPTDFLPATTLAKTCCDSMFNGCTSLTTGPDLPATTLTGSGATSCYYRMFYNCTSLNQVKCYATSGANTSTYQWLYNVASTGTFYGESTANWDLNSVSGVPTGWTVVDV